MDELEHLAHMTELRAVNLEGNPLASTPFYRHMAVYRLPGSVKTLDNRVRGAVCSGTAQLARIGSRVAACCGPGLPRVVRVQEVTHAERKQAGSVVRKVENEMALMVSNEFRLHQLARVRCVSRDAAGRMHRLPNSPGTRQHVRARVMPPRLRTW